MKILNNLNERPPRILTRCIGGLLISGLLGVFVLPAPVPSATAAAATPPATPAAAAAVPAAPAVPVPTADPGATPVAIVNGQAITERDLYNALLDIAGPGVLDQLILARLIDDAAEKAGVSVDAAAVSREYDQIRARFATADQFDQALQQAGLTPSLLREQIRINALLTALVSPLVKVTDTEVQTYYNQNKQTLGQPAQVRARHILVKTEQEANDLVKQLKAGADFAKLAQEHSIDTGSAAQGGELGFFTKDQMVQEFSQAAFSLPVGEISAPVQSQYGYHIIQVEEKKDAQVPTLDQAKATIQETLRAQKLNQMVPLWIQQLEATATIQRFWPPATAQSAPAGPTPSTTTNTQADQGAASPKPATPTQGS